MIRHSQDKEADAGFFEDWSAWEVLGILHVDQRYGLYVLNRLPNSTVINDLMRAIGVEPTWHHGHVRQIAPDWRVPACKWRALRTILPRITDHVHQQCGRTITRGPINQAQIDAGLARDWSQWHSMGAPDYWCRIKGMPQTPRDSGRQRPDIPGFALRLPPVGRAPKLATAVGACVTHNFRSYGRGAIIKSDGYDMPGCWFWLPACFWPALADTLPEIKDSCVDFASKYRAAQP